jgi:hypothetical protein
MRLLAHEVTLSRNALAVMAGVALTLASAAGVLSTLIRPAEPPIEASAPVASSGPGSAAASQARLSGQ